MKKTTADLQFDTITDVMYGSVDLTGGELSPASICDTLSPESLQALVEGIENEMMRKELLSKHKSPIKQLPNGIWYTRINGRKVQRVKRRDLENVVIDSIKPLIPTINNTFNFYLQCRKKDVADTTWQLDIRNYNRYIKDSPIGDKPLVQLTLDDGYQFFDYCMSIKTMTRHYWNNIRGTLSSILQYSINRSIIPGDPFEKLRLKKDLFQANKVFRDCDTVFSLAEQKAVCSLAENDSEDTKSALPLGIVLLFNLGIRDGELCALKWLDIEEGHNGTFIHIQREMVNGIDEEGHLDGYRIVNHCKTPAGDRRLYLNKKALATLSRVKELNRAAGIPTGDGDFIFLRIRKGKLLECNSRCIDARLRRYCKNAGMKVIKSPHDIRRTVLTNLYRNGMPIKNIQHFAGHASMTQTQAYLRLSDDDMDITSYVEALS